MRIKAPFLIVDTAIGLRAKKCALVGPVIAAYRHAGEHLGGLYVAEGVTLVALYGGSVHIEEPKRKGSLPTLHTARTHPRLGCENGAYDARRRVLDSVREVF